MRLPRGLIIFFVLFGFSLVSFGFIFWFFGNRPVCDFSVGKKECPELFFQIKKGERLSKIAADLQAQKIIRSAFVFKAQVFLNRLGGKIQAGEFYLSGKDTPLEVAWKLTRGTFDRKITIVEGLRAEEIGEYLLNQGISIDLETWVEKVNKEGVEGHLFPDTYMIPKSSSEEKIISIFSRNFDKKFTKELEREALKKGIDKESVLILASLIEREVKYDKDRPIVAGILLKRLEKGWLLQVDATVQYAVGNSKCRKNGTILSGCEWWPKKLSENDLKINSSFSTYINRGLPPTPICNPGLSAINSVIYPEESIFWFYLSDLQGNIHYAKDASEHEVNIRKYL